MWKQGQEKGTLGLYLLGHIDWGKLPPLKKNAPSKKSKLIQLFGLGKKTNTFVKDGQLLLFGG